MKDWARIIRPKWAQNVTKFGAHQHAHGNQWTLLGTNVPQWPYSWSALPAYYCMFQFLSLFMLILAVGFNHPIENVRASCSKHINPIRFKINWNNFKSYLIGSLSIRYTYNLVYFLSQVKLASLTKSSRINMSHHVGSKHNDQRSK